MSLRSKIQGALEDLPSLGVSGLWESPDEFQHVVFTDSACRAVPLSVACVGLLVPFSFSLMVPYSDYI